MANLFSSQQKTAYRTFLSTNDLSSSQYYLVGLDTSNPNQVVLANASTIPPIGILINNPKAGDEARVRLLNDGGTSFGIAGGTTAVGNYLTAKSDGTLVAATQTTAGSQPTVPIVGKALSVQASGDIFEFMVMGGWLY